MDLITGYYYLCDAGYPNADGFLDLYRGQQYHLQERRSVGNVTTNAKEYFNMKHSLARNVIERAFGVLKDHWVVLRGKSYYLLQVQTIVRASRPSCASESRIESSGSKRKRESQWEVDVEGIHLALDQTNEQLKMIAKWCKRALANDNHVRTKFIRYCMRCQN
ncbi:retrotransposon protein [Cucumis melo var. makuwa]|uniref:Retrotransposon protein n=1 Tax=Cucumis melo var. makuwa TaxID=1194695 RepID=A0A5D3BI31_CUCMM|nr:retrotransposon protein [Cucumis melo var. makuwa]TYJ98736.1 retrotransposon protein [Cucumis melo var. makuwa]